MRRPIECQHGATGLLRGDHSLNRDTCLLSTSNPPPWTGIRHDTLPIGRGTSYLAVAGLTVASWLIFSSPALLRDASCALAVLRLANIPPSSRETSRYQSWECHHAACREISTLMLPCRAKLSGCPTSRGLDRLADIAFRPVGLANLLRLLAARAGRKARDLFPEP